MENKIIKKVKSTQDPFYKIQMEQHRHRARTLWLLGGILLFACLSMTAYILISYGIENKDKHELFQKTETRLNDYFQKAPSLQGDAHDQWVYEGAQKAQKAFYEFPGDNRQRGIWFQYLEAFAKRLNEHGQKPIPEKPFINPTILGKMLPIPAGQFDMGARAKEPAQNHEYPRHTVNFDKPFWALETEVTFSQWWRMGNYQYKVKPWKMQTLTAYNMPISAISWHNANDFCMLLNEKEQLAGRLPNNYEYRLPTEAEWEYMSRAGSDQYFFWSDSFQDKGHLYANIWDRVAASKLDEVTHPDYPQGDHALCVNKVAAYKPNAFGLYDMIGNVSEWCYDWYSPNAYRELLKTPNNPVMTQPTIVDFAKRGVYNTQTIQEPTKIIRGGNWGSTQRDARCAARDFAPASFENIGVGFRIVLAPKLEFPNTRTVTTTTVDSPINSSITTPKIEK